MEEATAATLALVCSAAEPAAVASVFAVAATDCMDLAEASISQVDDAIPSTTVLTDASNRSASVRIAVCRSRAASAFTRSCSAPRRTASADRSFRTAIACAMVPISSRRSSPGTATERSPSARRCVTVVRLRIGAVMRRPSQKATPKLSSATAATMPPMRTVLFQVAASTASR